MLRAICVALGLCCGLFTTLDLAVTAEPPVQRSTLARPVAPSAGPGLELAKSIGVTAHRVHRFVDRGDYVEDIVTKLLWQKDGTESGKHNFYEAAEYAKQLQIGVLGEWRVPTAKELQDIFPATDLPFTGSLYNPNQCCKDGEFNNYWTSDLDKGPDYAFVYHWYAKGGANNCTASKNYCYVRCVRGPATAEDLTPLDEQSIARIDGLIAQLGSEDFKTRDAATETLKKEPRRIHPHLRKMLQTATDSEIKARLKSILRIGT